MQVLQKPQFKDGQDRLVSWILSNVDEWRTHRDSNFKEKWREYYRIWRGIWDPADKMRDSERSRLISPASQQAVESTVSELEEATFGRDQWFDIHDDLADQNPQDIATAKKLLKEDLEKEKCKAAIAESLLLGAIYGTGIGELVIDEKEEFTPAEQPIQPGVIARGSTSKVYKCVKLRAVSPFNFSTDPGIADIDDALGCAIDELVPRHIVIKAIQDGIYEDVEVGDYSSTEELMLSGEVSKIPSTNKVKITRYYGKVPLSYLTTDEEEDKAEGEDPNNETDDTDEEDELVEAVVVIANDAVRLKAVASPYMMRDRPVVAYQHDKVPGQFWGRGVIEKGYNPQKALDAELRARADNLALTTHPMMGIDATRLPRGMKPKIAPGQSILTNGSPKDILMPMNFGQLNPISYKESAELERMVTMATGAMDSAAPIGVNARNNTSSGMSMMMGASIKRQKRTLSNFQDNFLIPFIEKAMYRQMQFNPERYPLVDVKFVPSSTLGIMAREYEQQQFVQLLQTTPPESPAWFLIMQGVYENSSLSNRDDMIQALKMAMQQSQNKQPDPAQMAQAQAQQQKTMLDAHKLDQEGKKAQVDAMLAQQQLQFQAAELQMKNKELDLKAQELDIKSQEMAANAALKQVAQQQLHDRESAKIVADAHIKNKDANTYQQQTAAQHMQKSQETQAEKPEPVVVNVGGSKTIKLIRKNGVLEGATVEAG